MAGLDFNMERLYWGRGARFLAGVDEAGRGPLAGPVVAAAVIANPGLWIDGVDDSKKLTPSRREELFERITRGVLSWGVGIASHTEIDRVNILRATMQAMAEAVSRLDPAPDHLLVDGPRYDGGPVPFTPAWRASVCAPAVDSTSARPAGRAGAVRSSAPPAPTAL